MNASDTPPPEPKLDESALRSKLLTVPSIIVEKALILYVILTDRFTPIWVRVLVIAALVYLINPLDAIPDVLPGIGFADDLAVLALTLERLSRFVTPRVRMRARRLTPQWLKSGDDNEEHNSQPQTEDHSNTNNEQGEPDNGPEEENPGGRRSRVPFIERFRIFP
jgi:uncharacterized membrane protein YkvA (DUF1232 family)